MNLASLKFSLPRVLKAVMTEANFSQIWVYSEKNVRDFSGTKIDPLKSINERLQEILSGIDGPRKCFTLKIDAENPETNEFAVDCLSDNNFMCYKEELEMN